jgi:hypothetical protein
MGVLNKKRCKHDGIYIIDGRKYLFLKKRAVQDYKDHHCVYNNRRILNNRYKHYDDENHTFT